MSTSTAANEKKGPWGNLKDGNGKDTGIFTSLIRFTAVVHNKTGWIRGLNLEYMQNGVIQKTGFWGSGAGTAYDVTLGEGEFLVGIKGTNDHSLRTLTLISNKQEYGPYGKGGSNVFSLTPDGVNKIVGFHGRSVSGIDELTAIGVYMGPINLIPDKLDQCLKARDELEKTVAQLMANNTALKQEVDKTELARDKLEKTVAQLTSKNTSLKQEVDKTELERVKLEKMVAQLTANNVTLKQEVDKTEVARDKLEKAVAQLTAKNTALKQEVDKTELARYELEKTVPQLTAKNTSLKQEIDKTKLAKDELEKMVAQLTTKNTALKQERDDFDKMNAELKDQIDALKAELENKAAYKKKGPWGNRIQGDGKDTGNFTSLIRFSAIVDNQTGSIRGLNLEYMQKGVVQKTSFGGTGTGTTYDVTLGEGEFLIGIRGTYDHSLRTLTLISNKQEYGPYGKGGPNGFSLNPDGVNKIVGFHGRSVSGIDGLTAIGVYMGPIDELDKCLKAREELENRVAQLTTENTALKQEVDRTELAAYKKKGPWGNRLQGTGKDTGIFTSLIRFTAIVDNQTGSIRGLDLEYTKKGVMQKISFGGSGTGTAYHVTLGEGEFLAGIRGSYNDSLQTLTLISNKQEYGPYGKGGRNGFSLNPDGVNKIVGFHGRSVSGIDELSAIGVYMGPIDELDKCLKAREELEKTVAQLTAENTALKQEVGKS